MPYFKNIVVGVTTVAFCLTSIPVYAAPPLAPLSLGQMYSLAAQGNVRALRGAVQRGLNINITDRNGNTGLCHSIWKSDYTAYNAFQASGANPRHPCIQRIPTEKYDSFMSSWRVSDVAATPRDAYKYFNEGEFVVSDSAYWIGGALLIGGIAALALGGGGGGSKTIYRDIYTPTDYSLGAFVGTLTPTNPQNVPYVPVKYDIQIGETKINNADFGLSNNSTINIKNPDTGAEEAKPLSDLINFNKSVLENSKYIQVGMKASNGGFIQNGESPLVGTADGTVISLGDATAGMVALHNSQAINKNTIRITSKNASIGMIASDKSSISNDGKIDITFTGTSATNQVNGMYADTSASAINNGTIKGESVAEKGGTLIGMQARIINQESSPNPAMPTTLVNATSGSIALQATANAGVTTAKSLVGMGSYLEKAFLDGTQLIRRAGFVNMINQGDIDIDLTLNGTGAYGTDSGTLLSGTGGFIGMRADANATANNTGNINVNMHSVNAAAIINAHAGMQSVHGGSIANSKNVTVTGGSGGYGMLGIRGEGSNPEIDTRKPTIVNATDGIINVDSLDGFGMATYHGGNLSNAGNIILDSIGTGMHINDGVASNSGTISLTNSGQGMVIKRNTGAAEGATYNASKARITNTGNITIAKSDGAQGMYIEDGLAQNDGIINVGNTENTSTQSSYGMQAIDGTVINNKDINMNVLTTTVDSYGIHTTNAKASNNAGGSITFAQKGVGMHTGSGSNTNNGKIIMNSGGTGMSSETGTINNNLGGQITLNDNGTGILSTTGQINNLGTVTISGRNSNPSIGLKSGSKIINTGTVNMNGSNLTGIEIGENGEVLNAGNINLTTNANSVDNYGIKGTAGTITRIDNTGSITITGLGYDASVEQAYGISITDGEAYNHGDIIFNNIYGYGMSSTAAGVLRNYDTIDLNKGGIGMQGDIGKIFNEQEAIIDISGTPTGINSFGMKMTGNGSAWNDGIIIVAGNGQVGSNNSAYGIHVNGGNGVNNNIINMTSNNSYGMFDASSGAINNKIGAVINLSGNNSFGMMSTSGTSTNEGTINIGVNEAGVITGGNNSYGMAAGIGSSASNSGTINVNGVNSFGMLADAGTVTNEVSGIIHIAGANGTAFKTKNKGSAINNGIVTHTADNFVLSDISEGGSFVNNGTVSTTGNGNKVMEVSQDGTLENNGNVVVNGSNSYGMYSTDNSVATNNNHIIVNGIDSYGMYAVDEGTLTNTVPGIIDVIGAGSSGMAAQKETATVNNNGTINLKGNNTAGINLIAANENGVATNNGKINITADNSIGMKANGGTLTNDIAGIITLASGTNSHGIQGNATAAFGSNIINKGNVNSNSTATGDGIRVLVDTAVVTDTTVINTVNNSGKISLKNISNGIYAERANVTNAQGATISLEKGGVGINADKGNGSNLIMNKGTINVGSDATSANPASGIVVTDGYNVANDLNALITVKGENARGITSTSSSITNGGTITTDGLNSIAISSNTGVINNAATGVINVNGTNGKGIVSNAANFTNNGLINVNGTNAIGMETAISGAMINNKDIALSGANSIGMNVVGSGKANNTGKITATANGAKAMSVSSGAGSASNTGNIEVSGANASGMHAASGNVVNDVIVIPEVTDPDTGAVITPEQTFAGNILVNNASATGMSSNGGTATNKSTIDVTLGNGMQNLGSGGAAINDVGANINLNGANSFGIYSTGVGTVTNNGTISDKSSGSKNYLMYATNGTAINNAALKLNGSNSIAMYADGGTIINALNGRIDINSTDYSINPYLMYVKSGSGMNLGILATDYNNFSLMAMDAGTISNSGTLNVGNAGSTNTNISGILVKGGSATNSTTGIINVNAQSSFGMKALGGTATNEGTINVTGNNSVAMYATNGTIVNAASGILNSTQGTYSAMPALMYVDGTGMALNQGIINVNKNNFNGIYVNSGSAENSGTISLNANNSMGIYNNSTTGSISNTSTGWITTVNGNVIALDAAGGIVTNAGNIKLVGISNKAIRGTANTSIINSGNITMGGVDSVDSVGIEASGNATVNNSGSITMEGVDSVGIEASGNATVNNAGDILMTGTGSIAIEATNSATVVNSGDITLSQGGIGISSENGVFNRGYIKLQKAGTAIKTTGGSVNNSGSISVKSSEDGEYIGIEASGNIGTITNTGTIEVGQETWGVKASGIKVTSSNAATSIINSGTIKVAAKYYISPTNFGIYLDGPGNSVNDTTGRIEMSGDENYGMYAKGGATATNNGTIKITDSVGTDISYGMYAEGGSHLVNNGTIDMNGSAAEIIGMYATGAGATIKNNGTIILNGTALVDDAGAVCDADGCGSYIKLADGATLINSSRMASSRAMNFASFSDDGTGSVIIGKGGSFEAPEISGDIKASSDIVMGSQKDEYVNSNSFVGDDKGIEIASGSYMFDAAIKTNDKGNMDVVMTRKEFSSIMENQKIASYLENNYSISHSIFDALKIAGSANGFASVTNESLGLNLIPSFAKQNLDVIKSLNRQVNQAIFNNDEEKPMRAMVGYDFFNREQDGTNVLSGYKDEASSAYGLFDKKYDNNLRYGFGLSVSKYESDYDNGSTRDEFVTQALGLLSYENNDFRFISAPRLGVGFGDYTRATVDGRYEADTLNYYYGVTNEVRKDIDMGAFTLEPVAEFNILGVYQNRTKEDGQLIVESSNNLSVETGLGLYAKKEFQITEKDIIKLRAGGTYYHELNNPYQAAKARIDGLNGSYHMDSYDTQRDRGVLSTRIDYKHEEFDFYAEANKYLEEDAGYSLNAGIGYRF